SGYNRGSSRGSPPPGRKSKAEGILATNRDYIHYEQVQKPQAYHLAESGGAGEFDLDYRIRTCDIGRVLRGNAHDRSLFAMELGQALQEIGFAILEGHGIDARDHERAEAEVVRMF